MSRSSAPAPSRKASNRLESPALDRVLFGGYFLALVCVFSLSVRQQFTLPKLLVFRVGATVFLVCALLAMLQGASRKVPRAVAAATLALAAWWAFSTIFATHRDTALNGYYGRYNGLLNHLLYLAVFLALGTLPFTVDRVERVLRLFVLSLIPVSLYAILQARQLDPIPWRHVYGPGLRPSSSIGHPVLLAAVLGLAIPFSILFLATAPTVRRRWVWGTVLLLLAVALSLTLSRGPWVGTICAVAVVGWALRGQMPVRRARLFVAVAIILSIAGAWMLAASSTRRALGPRLQGFLAPTSDPSLAWRFRIYGAATRMVADHPVVGTGFETFHNLYLQYRPPQDTSVAPVPTMVYNGYLQTAQESGLPGLALFLGTLFVLFRWLLASYRRAADARSKRLIAAFLASLLGFSIQDLSGWPEVSTNSLFWFLAGLSVAATAEETTGPDSVARPRRTWILALVAGVVAAFALALDAGVRYDADAQYRRALQTEYWQEREALLLRASELLPAEALYKDAAARGFYDRFVATGEREAYDKSLAMLTAARAASPYEMAVLVHAVALDSVAFRRGLIDRPSILSETAASELANVRGDPKVTEALA